MTRILRRLCLFSFRIQQKKKVDFIIKEREKVIETSLRCWPSYRMKKTLKIFWRCSEINVFDTIGCVGYYEYSSQLKMSDEFLMYVSDTSNQGLKRIESQMDNAGDWRVAQSPNIVSAACTSVKIETWWNAPRHAEEKYIIIIIGHTFLAKKILTKIMNKTKRIFF